MIVNDASLQALRVTFEKRFGEAYQEIETFAPKIATEVTSGTEVNVYGWIANQIALREWIGQRQAIAMGEHSYSLRNRDWEATLKLPRKQILDDNLGIYTDVLVPQFAAAVAKHPDLTLINDVFSANPTAFDGQAFWSTAHPTFAADGSTYSNDFDLELTDADLVQSAINIQSVRTAMRTIKGENGIILATDPRMLIVPPELEYVAFKLCRSESFPVSGTAAPVANWIRGVLDFMVIPELSAVSSGDWYLADVSKPLKFALWQVRSRPVFRAFDDPTQMHAFMNNEFIWGIDGDDGGPYRAAAGVTLPFLCARSGPT